MSAVIKKFIPEKIAEKTIPKPITRPPVTEHANESGSNMVDVKSASTDPNAPNYNPNLTVKATEGPSKTEVEMSSGMDGVTENLNRKKKGRSKTILTSSQGLSDEVNLVKPSLLG